MGISNDGILVYGIDFGSADDMVGTTAALFEEGEETGDVGIEKWMSYAGGEEFWKGEPGPLVYVRHCSYDYPMFIIGFKGTVTEASRGNPSSITFPTIEPDPAPLKKFCEEHGLEYEPPRWLLCTMNG